VVYVSKVPQSENDVFDIWTKFKQWFKLLLRVLYNGIYSWFSKPCVGFSSLGWVKVKKAFRRLPVLFLLISTNIFLSGLGIICQRNNV
jgi:hypothetical protein